MVSVEEICILKKLLERKNNGQSVSGDVAIIIDLMKIIRSTSNLLDTVDKTKKGAALKSIKVTWRDTSSDNPYNDFLLTERFGKCKIEMQTKQKL